MDGLIIKENIAFRLTEETNEYDREIEYTVYLKVDGKESDLVPLWFGQSKRKALALYKTLTRGD